MHLSNLNKVIEIQKVYNFKKNKNFSSITSNSKFINNNTIFVYDKNSKSTLKYVNEAIKNKTPAIISNKYFKSISVPQFIVSNIKLETELLLKKLYKKMPYKSIAVTGTNGKTSVVWYVSKILTALNYYNTTVGTLGYFKNGKKIDEIGLTTPAYEELFKYGSHDIPDNKNNIFIFEASSHALHQDRIRNYPIDIAAITNITSDHLDYHKKFHNYKNSKIKIFTKYLSKNGYAVINTRIKNFSSIKKKILENNKIINYGKNFIFFENKNKNKNIRLKINNNYFKIKNLKLNTNIEFENLECAISCCIALKIDEKKIVNVLHKISNPPGRLQKLKYRKNNSIFIDYAHTPDALEKTLLSVKFNNKKPVLVFGCGGERDKKKRKSMGIIANKFASKVYVTDDNPRNEDPSKIRKNILKYCPGGIEIPHRKLAIIKAINDLKINETLVIAGKGHEKIQIIKNKKIKFDDYEIVKKIIQS